MVIRVFTTQPDNSYEVEGVNDRSQLSKLERIHQTEKAEKLLRDGIMLADPATN